MGRGTGSAAVAPRRRGAYQTRPATRPGERLGIGTNEEEQKACQALAVARPELGNVAARLERFLSSCDHGMPDPCSLAADSGLGEDEVRAGLDFLVGQGLIRRCELIRHSAPGHGTCPTFPAKALDEAVGYGQCLYCPVCGAELVFYGTVLGGRSRGRGLASMSTSPRNRLTGRPSGH
jgi:hypothetical protein